MKLGGMDKLTERFARGLARGASRRSLLAMIGGTVTGAAVFPVLPVSRAVAATHGDAGAARAPVTTGNPQDPGDQTQCDYWRYCAIDGALCTCCGGGIHTCPAGSEPSPVSWVGSCINPDDGKAYMIAYRDCCGKPACGQCGCDNTDRETQVYLPQLNNNVIWCFGTSSMEYHCSTAIMIGAA